jgi:hypothetical protein
VHYYDTKEKLGGGKGDDEDEVEDDDIDDPTKKYSSDM